MLPIWKILHVLIDRDQSFLVADYTNHVIGRLPVGVVNRVSSNIDDYRSNGHFIQVINRVLRVSMNR